MQDRKDIARRALEKIQADRLAQQQAMLQPSMLEQQPILEQPPVAQLGPAEGVQVAQLAPQEPVPAALAPPTAAQPDIAKQLTPDVTTMRAVVPPQASTKELQEQKLRERLEQLKDVGRTTKEILFGAPLESSEQRQIRLEEEAAAATKLKEDADSELAKELIANQTAEKIVETGVAQPETASGRVTKVATTPDPDVVEKKVDEIMEPEREEASDEVAKEVAAAEREELQQQALERIKREVELKNEAQAAVDASDAEVRFKSLPQIFAEGTFGQKLGTALALLIGGVSQGLTGAKTNPVMDMLDRLAQQQADKDKLSLEQRESLRKIIYEEADAQIRRMQANTNDEYRKDQMQIARDRLNQASQEIGQEQTAAAATKARSARLNFGKRLTVDDIASLTNEQQNRKITLERLDPATGYPMQVLADSPRAAEAYRAYAQDVSTSTATIDELVKLADDPTAFVNFLQKGNAKMLQEALVGALRLPFKGPGSLQLQEQKDLREIAVDPTALFSVRSWSKARLLKLKNHLNTRLQAVAKTSGINEPVTPQVLRVVNKQVVPEDAIFAAAKKKNPDISTEKLLELIDKQYPIFEGF